MAEYHSVGRGTVENWIKNSIYEKYNISNEDMRAFSKMSPIDMMSDFGKTVEISEDCGRGCVPGSFHPQSIKVH